MHTLALLALWSTAAYAAPPAPTGVIDAVVVYPDRAAVTRVLSVDLVAGNNVIEFLDLPPTVDARTITSEGKGVEGAQLLGFDVVSRELAEDRRARVADLERQIEAKADQIRADRDAAEAARVELQFLTQLQSAAAQQVSNELFFTPNTAGQADAIASMLASRVPAAQKAQREAEWAARAKEAEIGALRRELEATRGASQWARRDVRVEIASPKAGPAEISVTYVLPGASWVPQYDVRALPDEKKVSLVMNALVTQTSGEDWTAAHLSLSTARPVGGIDPPALDPFWLEPVVVYSYGGYDKDDARGYTMSAPESYDDEMAKEEVAAPEPEPVAAPMAVAQATVTEREVASTFEVPGRTGVTGDGTRRKVRVTGLDLPVEFAHVVVPRVREQLFVVATAKWEQSWPLLPGEIASFLGDSFVGTSAIGLVGTGQELELGFGPDDAVQVEVERVESMESLPDWMGQITATRSWRYAVHSGRKAPVTVELRDRLPKSDDARYRVRQEGDACDELTPEGLCTWRREVPAGGDVAVQFGYVLRYPRRAPPAEVE